MIREGQKANVFHHSVTSECTPAPTDHMAHEEEMARPERFELPTTWFEASVTSLTRQLSTPTGQPRARLNALIRSFLSARSPSR